MKTWSGAGGSNGNAGVASAPGDSDTPLRKDGSGVVPAWVGVHR